MRGPALLGLLSAALIAFAFWPRRRPARPASRPVSPWPLLRLIFDLLMIPPLLFMHALMVFRPSHIQIQFRREIRREVPRGGPRRIF